MKAAISMLLLLMGFSLCACDNTHDVVAKFVYTKDTRTNQCFAIYHMTGGSTNSGSMTWVPCTPEVEKQIKKDEAAQN